MVSRFIDGQCVKWVTNITILTQDEILELRIDYTIENPINIDGKMYSDGKYAHNIIVNAPLDETKNPRRMTRAYFIYYALSLECVVAGATLEEVVVGLNINGQVNNLAAIVCD